MSTPLSDPDNVKFDVVDVADVGFTADEVKRILSGQPLDAVTAAGDFDEVEHPRDNKGKFAKKAGGAGIGKKIKITHALIHKKHEPGTVIVVNKDGDKRAQWDGKKYLLQSKTDGGDWQTDDEAIKTKAYVKINAYDSDWHAPGDEDASASVAKTKTPAPKPSVEKTSQPTSKKTTPTPVLNAPESTVDYTLVNKKNRIFAAPDGQQYILGKPSKNAGHPSAQVMTSHFYQLAGVNVADAQVVKLDGKGTITNPSPWTQATRTNVVDGEADLESRLSDPEYRRKLFEDFAVDAWLGNTGVVGNSFKNVVTDGDGNPVRTNFTNALMYAESGNFKTFDSNVTEIDSMRDSFSDFTNGEVFGDITDDEIRAGVAKIEAISPEQIDAAIDAAVSANVLHKNFAPKLREVMKARRQYLIDRFGSNAPKPTDESATTAIKTEVTEPAQETKTYTPAQVTQVQSIFAKQNLKWHSDSKKIFDAALDVTKADGDLTMADALTIMDQSLIGKKNDPFQTKIKSFLATKAGKEFAESRGVIGPARPITAPEAYDIQRRMNKQTPPPWTSEQKSAIRAYTVNSTKINDCLRGLGACDSATQDNINAISAGMKPNLTGIIVYRKASAGSFGVKNLSDLEKMVGKVVEDKGFVSTSVSSNVAAGTIEMQIEVPRGTKMMWVKSLSKYAHEDEMLLDSGLRFVIVGVVPPAGPGKPIKLKLRAVPNGDQK